MDLANSVLYLTSVALFLMAFAYMRLRCCSRRSALGFLILLFVNSVLHGGMTIELEAPVRVAGPYLVGRSLLLLFSLVLIGGSLIGQRPEMLGAGATGGTASGEPEEVLQRSLLEAISAGVLGFLLGSAVGPAVVTYTGGQQLGL